MSTPTATRDPSETLALEKAVGQRVQERPLDSSAQGARAVGRVVSLLGQEVEGFLRQAEFDRPVGQAAVYLGDAQTDDFA